MTPRSWRPMLSDMEAVSLAAIRLGGLAAGVSAAAFLVWAAITGDLSTTRNAIGPGALAAVCGLMLWRGWRRVELVLVLGALSTVFSFRSFGAEATATPAAIGAVAIVSVGALFVNGPWKWVYVWLGSLGLLLTGPFWQGWTASGIWIGISSALSGSIAMVLFVGIRDAAIAGERRYRVLVEKVPTPLMEQDWTALRASLRELRSSGVTDLESHLDANPEWLIGLMKDAKVRSVNPAVEDMVGVSVADLGGPGTSYGVPLEDLEPFVRRELIAMWEDRSSPPSDVELRLASGERLWARFETADIEAGLIPRVDRVVVATDVTELKAAQSRLAELVRSKDEFVAAVSHELRTPLTSVLGFAELIAAEPGGLSSDQQEMLDLLLGQAKDMAHIVEDLLVAARAEIGTIAIEAQPLDLSWVVHDALAQVEHSFDLIADGRPVVLADRVRVAQILRNLLTNAARYGGDHRRVVVGVDGDAGVIEVCDNGRGIAPGDHDRIFEPYTRAHDRPGMTASVGLGLAVSRQLAQLMGGTLEYHRNGDSSIFRLALPTVSLGESAA